LSESAQTFCVIGRQIYKYNTWQTSITSTIIPLEYLRRVSIRGYFL